VQGGGCKWAWDDPQRCPTVGWPRWTRAWVRAAAGRLPQGGKAVLPSEALPEDTDSVGLPLDSTSAHGE
jgi:hypothetical protein